jgi:hypothetical protein
MASGQTMCVFMPNDNEPPIANYATLDFRNSVPCLDFDGTTDEEAVFSALLPGQYGGGGLTIVLEVAYSSATSGSSRWQADIERGNTDIDADSFTGTFQSGGGTANATSGITGQVILTFTEGAQMDSLAAGERFRLKIRRDADGTSGTDDIATDAELYSIHVKET